MTVHAIGAPHIPDKLHHAFAGPLGIKDFDIRSTQSKKWMMEIIPFSLKRVLIVLETERAMRITPLSGSGH